jgi:hypothetical protein
MAFIRIRSVILVFALAGLVSCLPEQKLARNFVKSAMKIRLMVTPPDYVYKYNHKGEGIEGFSELNEAAQDSALLASSDFIQYLSDSLILETYVNRFIGELRKAGFEVYLPDQMDAFLSDQSQAYMVNLAQIQLDEYYYPYTDKETIDDSTYVKKINLNAVDMSVWIELSKANASKPRKTILYNSQTAYDDFQGLFKSDGWTGTVRYIYKLDSLTVANVYDMVKYLGEKHGEYLFDFFMNQWVAFSMPPDQYINYYYHYNRRQNILEVTEDERFEILPGK